MSDEAPTITASKITTYLQCGRKYAFRYLDRLPVPWKPSALAFGSAVHSALEIFHEKRMDGVTPSADEVVHAFLVDWEAELAGELRFKDGEDAATLRSQGEALLRLYVAQNADLPVVRAVEWPFEVALIDTATGEILGPNLRGIFDLVLDGDTLVEIKTAARGYDAGTLARHVQLSAYAYAYRQSVGRDPTLKVVALLKHKKPKVDLYEAARTPLDDAWFVHVAAEVGRGIEAGVFPPNPGWQCADCEFAEPCRAWRGVASVSAPTGVRHLPIAAEVAP